MQPVREGRRFAVGVGMRCPRKSETTLSEQTPLPVACTSATFSKQSCLFRDVCLYLSKDKASIQAVIASFNQPEHVALLQQHLSHTLSGVYANISVEATRQGKRSPVNETQTGTNVWNTTLLWRPVPWNQESFGHALINEAFPMFLVLQDHLGPHLPTDISLLIVGSIHPVLQHVITGNIAQHLQLVTDNNMLAQTGSHGFCFQQLIIGDGGYVATSRASLANSGSPHKDQYGKEPSFFSSINWWGFRLHSLKVRGCACFWLPACLHNVPFS